FFSVTCSISSLYSFPTRRSSDLVLGLRARDEHPVVDVQLEMPEAAAAADVRHRLAPRPAAHRVLEGPRSVRLELAPPVAARAGGDRKSTRLNSSHVAIPYAVFRL